jgi:hypothetical protein
MPTITLLDGLAVDSATRDLGHRVIGPLMHQYWGPIECSQSMAGKVSNPQGDAELSQEIHVATVPQVDGWGLKSVQRMSQPSDSGQTATSSRQESLCGSRQRGACTANYREDMGPEERSEIEKQVEAAVGRAIEVERRWTELDACWDSIIAEVLNEWKAELA